MFCKVEFRQKGEKTIVCVNINHPERSPVGLLRRLLVVFRIARGSKKSGVQLMLTLANAREASDTPDELKNAFLKISVPCCKTYAIAAYSE